MTELSFFQRYSARENHITNNVLLMLRMLYRAHPQKLQTVIEGILSSTELEDLGLQVGPTFEQQVRGKASVPDALLQQQPFTILVEVKPGSHWDEDQIKRHIKTAKSLDHGNRIVLLLSTDGQADFDKTLKKKAKASDIRLANTTFETLLSLVSSEEVVGPHESDLREVVEDFRDVLSENDLLDDPYEIFAFGCSRTLQWNLRHSIYYDHVTRPSKANVPTAFYAQRRIHALGHVAACLVGSVEEGFNVEMEHASKTKNELVAYIEKAVAEGGPSSDETLRWYIYDEIHETDFRKETPYGYYQGVWMHLEYYLDDDIDPKDLGAVADALKGESFGKDRGYDE